MIAKLALLAMVAAVGAMCLAMLGRLYDWSPFGLVLSGMVAGGIVAAMAMLVLFEQDRWA